MRILFVHDRFGAFAGAEVNLYLSASALKKRGHSVAVLHGQSTGKGEDGWRSLFSDRFACLNGHGSVVVDRAIQQFDPDAIYVHKMSELNVLKTLVASGRPLIRMVHDHDLYCLRSYKYSPVTRKICQRAASIYCVFPCGAPLLRNRAGPLPFRWVSYLDKRREIKLNQRFHRLVVASEYMKNELLRNGFAPGQIEIHAPVPVELATAAASSFSARNLIVYSGQVVRGKGVDILLRALARVDAPFECVILGDGSHRPYCENLCRSLGLDKKICFKGYVPPDELAAYYADASLAVMSSLWPEPFGAAGLEAMRYGLPVVAFDVGGIGEWLRDGENGFLVPHLDHARFGERVEQLLRDKELARELGARGRRIVREKFSFNEYINGLENMLERVAGRRTIPVPA